MKKIVHNKGFSHHMLLPLLAVLAVGGIGLYMLNMSSAATGGFISRKAYRAADFIDSEGVVAHVDADESYLNAPNVLGSLSFLGVHHVRSRNLGEGAVKTLLAQNGVKFDFMTVVPRDNTIRPLSAHTNENVLYTKSRVTDILTNPAAGDKYVKSAAYVEPLNEYDNQSTDDPLQDTHWADTLAVAQSALWSTKPSILAQNPKTKILGPAFIGFKEATSTATLQPKNIVGMMDYGNVHSYPDGTPPETNLQNGDGLDGFVVPISQLPSSVTGDVGQKLQHYSTRISGRKRIVVTEEGYHDYTDQPAGSPKYTDRNAVGIYAPRVYLENFRIGVLKTYIYEMYDENVHSKPYEMHYGLFEHTTADGLPNVAKPAAIAIHDMNSVLSDSGAQATTFRPGVLKYSIVRQPTSVKALLLQKSSNKFYLVVWKAESVFIPGNGPGAGRYTGPTAPTSYTINFDTKRTVNAFYDGGTTSTSLGSGRSSYTFNVSAKQTVLEIH